MLKYGHPDKAPKSKLGFAEWEYWNSYPDTNTIVAEARNAGIISDFLPPQMPPQLPEPQTGAFGHLEIGPSSRVASPHPNAAPMPPQLPPSHPGAFRQLEMIGPSSRVDSPHSNGAPVPANIAAGVREEHIFVIGRFRVDKDANNRPKNLHFLPGIWYDIQMSINQGPVFNVRVPDLPVNSLKVSGHFSKTGCSQC